jgi:zinc dependent phospholipase C
MGTVIACITEIGLMTCRIVKALKLFLILIFFRVIPCYGYSVLTHEAIIDANWDQVIAPILKQRFPNATAEDLKKAHAFAYGGSVSPDLGYYPFGSKMFTNLVHYVRSGDFVENLFLEAKDINEYAFALGVLCHYNADIEGHSSGVNKSVPLIYPDMKQKFGNVVTYGDDKLSHLRTEFAFDVLQTARGNYASEAYHDFIGFQVSKDLLERAFRKTYGLEVKDLFGDFDRAVGSFRWAVKSLLPTVTKAAWKTKNGDIKKSNPAATKSAYIYRIKRHEYYSEFGKERDKPGVGASIVSFLIRIVPKIGPLKVLKFKTPTPESEKLFLQSFDSTVLRYHQTLIKLNQENNQFANRDWDTGKETRQYEYRLADIAYSDWVIKLKEKNFETVSPMMRENIFSFYKNYAGDPAVTEEQWQKTTVALEELKSKK